MEFIQPHNIREALRALKKWGKKGMVVAGGTNLLPDLRAKKVSPEALIDLSRIDSLSFIEAEEEGIRIGALSPIAEIADSKILQKKSSDPLRSRPETGQPFGEKSGDPGRESRQGIPGSRYGSTPSSSRRLRRGPGSRSTEKAGPAGPILFGGESECA